MRKGSDIVSDILGGVQNDALRNASSLFRSWRDLVGQDVAALSRIVDVDNGCVIVAADHPGWLQLIQMKRSAMLKKIRISYPELNVKDMRFFLDSADLAGNQSATGPVNDEGPRKYRFDEERVEQTTDKDSEEYREFKALLERVKRLKQKKDDT
jgi:hypothetical protein